MAIHKRNPGESLFPMSVLADEFLKSVRVFLTTDKRKLYVEPRDKNTDFSRDYEIFQQDQVRMILRLSGQDCVAIEPNNNPRYPRSLVYVFKREYEGLCYKGEEAEKPVGLYIKLYINDDHSRHYGRVIAISFHPDEFPTVEENRL